MSDLEAAASSLKQTDLAIRDMCDDLDPNIITVQSAPSMDKELADINTARNAHRTAVREFLTKFSPELTSPQIEQWNADLKSLVNRVNTHKMEVIGKVNELIPPTQPMTEYEKSTMLFQQKQLEFQEKQLEMQSKADSNKKTEAHAVAKPLLKLITDKCTDLDDELEQIPVSTIETVDDQLITRSMQKLSVWQNLMDSILILWQDLVAKTAVYPLEEHEMSDAKAAVESSKAALTNARTLVEGEDLRRQLYSLDVTSRAEQVKWPSFAGEPGEDYVKFEKDFLDACKQNKISLRNQIVKLKENLKGYAKTLIPASTTDITAALAMLKRVCGDPMRVVNHRIENLLSVGPWPVEGTPDCYTKQVKWIVKVQGLIQEIIDLANTSDELGAVIYNRHQLAHILKLFPIFMLDKLAEIPGYHESKYKQIIDKLDKWKTVSLNREAILGTSAAQKQQQPGQRSGKPPSNSSGHVTFPKPKRLATCRICKVLEAQGNTTGLYDGHISDFATGCPQFASMGTEQRIVVAKEAKFCVNCMGKEIKFNLAHLRECPVKKKKNSYSCRKDSCLLHMWLCKKHSTLNKDHMEKFGEQLRTKSGINLTFLTVRNDPGVSSGKAKSAQPDPEVRISPVSYCSKEDTGIKRAVRKLHRLNKKKDPDVITVSPPDGVPLFLFQPIEGINNAVNVFYDLGCSDAIFRSGIPGTELRGTLLNKGPFPMGGVGDITTMADEEWLVQLNRVDGKKQLVRGVTLKQITCNFPEINTTDAVKEVLDNHKENEFLQSCKVPKIAGGMVDVLLGIKYSLIQPVPIQTLDNGLTIYRSKLVSHNKSENALIGGPHESFQFLANKAGGTGALLAHFTEGLAKVRQLGPPKIPTNPFTLEEEAFALAHTLRDVKEIVNSCSETQVSCSSCLYNMSIDEDNGDTLREIRRLRLEQECGVDIGYRCVKCRDCSTCKNSDRIEAISLKEEAEMDLIDQSVQLDLEGRRILCSLPLRGEERQFLSSNYNRAVKVLEQQVKQYGNQAETKEMILKAFDKLFTNGHACFLEDVHPDDLKQFVDKEISYFIPWRIAFSDSVTTPARPVLDASSRTARRPDGSGGKSLNELVCQGKVESLNLLNLVLNFRVGRYALTGDLAQFYNACKLIPSQWNLQRFLFQPNMDPCAPIREGVIKTLIYGVSSVSAQSECAMKKLGNVIQEKSPHVKDLIEKRRYVDDIGDSKSSKEQCIQLAEAADRDFSLVGLTCKCWTFSGQDPDTKVSKDGVSVSVAGSQWFPKLDLIVVKVPPLHFGKRRRGKLDERTKFFTGTTIQDMDEFCPKTLNRKQVTSKYASIWDMTGKLAPVLAEAKCLLSETVANTSDWVSPMPDNLRSKWLHQFLLWENLRGLKFERAVMPADAINDRMRLIVKVDATDKIINSACWGGFKRSTGDWSCQQILARTLLAPRNSTIPKLELQALTNGSNMGWILRKMLDDWVSEYVICGDSVIALCWVSSEKKSLSLYHRNRVIQVRRGSELDKLFHVKTEENLADLGTRPERIKVTDVGPESEWELGKSWMRGEIDDAVVQGILKPVSELRITPETDSGYKEGLILGSDPFNMFCNAVNNSRVEKLRARLEYSNYLLNPARYDFRKLVRILALVIGFIKKCRGKNLDSLKTCDSTFPKLSSFAANHDLNPAAKPIQCPVITDDSMQQALVYLYRKSTREVMQFNPKSKMEKIGILKEGILFSRTRLIDGMNFEQTGGLVISDLGDLGIKALTPILDRFSPLAYCIARHVHWNLGRHKGVETCTRICLEHVSIMQGANLFKELGEECIRCRIKRKKYLEMPMGTLSDHQLRICPPFWAAQMDMFGPIQTYVPGFEKSTRNRKALQAECFVLVFACPVSRLVNLQVIEKKDSSGVLDGITRLACEVGVPKVLLIDQDAAFIKVANEVEFSFQDAELKLNREHGIEFLTCPVSGHNQHGQVERRIRSVQDSLDEVGLKSRRIHATGLQTLLKLVENQLNNMPLGYSFGRDQNNTPLLKIISPNMLRVGRNNSRSLDGPMRLPKGGDLLDKVQETYDMWFRIWSEAYVPKVMFQPKWWNAEDNIKEQDLVMFKKKESVLEGAWSMGTIDQLIRGKDGRARRAIVKYRNKGEDMDRFSDRNVRSLVKIWSIDDQSFEEDISALEKLLRDSQKGTLLMDQYLGNVTDPGSKVAGDQMSNLLGYVQEPQSVGFVQVPQLMDSVQVPRIMDNAQVSQLMDSVQVPQVMENVQVPQIMGNVQVPQISCSSCCCWSHCRVSCCTVEHMDLEMNPYLDSWLVDLNLPKDVYTDLHALDLEDGEYGDEDESLCYGLDLSSLISSLSLNL